MLPQVLCNARLVFFDTFLRHIVPLECLGTQRCTKLQVQTICWKCRNIPQKEWEEYRISEQYQCFQKSGLGVASWISTNAVHCLPSLISSSFALCWIPILGALQGNISIFQTGARILKCHKWPSHFLPEPSRVLNQSVRAFIRIFKHVQTSTCSSSIVSNDLFLIATTPEGVQVWVSPMVLRWGHIQCPGAQGIDIETEGDGRAFCHFKAWRPDFCKIIHVMIWWDHVISCDKMW